MRTLRICTVLLALTVALGTVMPVAGQGAVRVFVDGDQVAFDQPPLIVGSRVLVPLRGIFEKMGAFVEWIPSTRTVRAIRGTTVVALRIGSRIAEVNGRSVTLDVPAQIVGGRTLVPLRFISESLGAQVVYDAPSRAVIITTGVSGQPGRPPAQTTTLKGVIVAVTPPTITVESGNVASRIRIAADTIITRVDAATGSGGSVSVTSLRRGDDAEVTLRGDEATRVRATYLMTTGQIEAVARASRTLVFTDGRTFRYVSDVAVLARGRPAANGLAALAAGQTVELRLNPTTRSAWEINIVSGAAAQITLQIIRPEAGSVVSSPVRVSGATAAGAQVVITVAFQGDVMGRRTVTANSAGRFDTTVAFTIRRRNATYVVVIRASHRSLGEIVKRVSVTVR